VLRLTADGLATLLGAAGLCLGAAAGGYPELLEAGAVGLGALMLSVASAVRRPEVSMQVRLSSGQLVDGDPPTLTVTLTNHGRRRCHATLLRLRVGTEPVRIELGGVGAGTRMDFTPSLPPLRRGVYPVAGARLQYRDPFDLVRTDHELDTLATLHVHPRTAAVAPMPVGGRVGDDGRPLVSARAGGDAFHSLRDYAPGDDRRRIHWPSSARRGRLMVQHTTLDEESAHVVVLSVDRAGYEDEAGFEQAVRIAASVCRATAHDGHHLHLVTASGSPGVPPAGPAAERCRAALDRLAGVRPDGDDASLPPVSRLPPSAHVMVVAGHTTPALVRWLAGCLHQRRRVYLVSVLGSTRPRADVPPGIRTLTVDGLDAFRAAWPRSAS
jgi:uncharacterized protein (DUF58 family)